MGHTIRPMEIADADDIGALLDWAWFAARSEAGWRWLARTPRSQAARRIPIGWVAEDDEGRIGAVVGAFAQDYVIEGDTAVGVTGHTLIVHPRLKGVATDLINTYNELPDAHDVFGVFHLNANARSAPIYPRFGFDPWPVDRGDLKLTWITDPMALVAERATRLMAGQGRPSAERLVRSGHFTADLVRLGPDIEQIFAADIDDRFDVFWRALAAEGRLTARRDAASLRWRMADPDRTVDPILLGWMEGGLIAGYVLAQIGKTSQVECANLEIVDLVALKHAADRAMPDLVAALLRNAPRLGVARVRLPVATRELERRLASLPGMLRQRKHVHGHARLTPRGQAMASRWRLTPFDADYGFCLRSPPRPTDRSGAP